jgi:hypothetical protein
MRKLDSARLRTLVWSKSTSLQICETSLTKHSVSALLLCQGDYPENWVDSLSGLTDCQSVGRAPGFAGKVSASEMTAGRIAGDWGGCAVGLVGWAGNTGPTYNRGCPGQWGFAIPICGQTAEESRERAF